MRTVNENTPYKYRPKSGGAMCDEYRKTYFLSTEGAVLPELYGSANIARVEATKLISARAARYVTISVGDTDVFVVYYCSYHNQFECVSLQTGKKHVIGQDGKLISMGESEAIACDAKKKKSHLMRLFSRKKRNQKNKQFCGQSQLVTVFYEDGTKEIFISDFPMVVAIAHANTGGHTSFTISDARFEKRGVKQTLFKDKKGNWKDENGKFVFKISH